MLRADEGVVYPEPTGPCRALRAQSRQRIEEGREPILSACHLHSTRAFRFAVFLARRTGGLRLDSRPDARGKTLSQ